MLNLLDKEKNLSEKCPYCEKSNDKQNIIKYEAIINTKTGKYQNVIILQDGSIKTVNYPGINGILINYLEDFDKEGSKYFRPVVSTLCEDNELSEKLFVAAMELLSYIKSMQPDKTNNEVGTKNSQNSDNRIYDLDSNALWMK